MLKKLPLHTRIAAIPIVCAGILLAISIAFGTLQTLQKKVLDQVTGSIVNRSQAAIDGLEHLSKRHLAVVDLLSEATAGRFDEEQVYIAGETLLAELAGTEEALEEIITLFNQSAGEVRLVRLIEQHLTRYKIAAASSIEMATVDSSLAAEQLVAANQSYSDLYNDFLQLLDLTKSELGTSLDGLSDRSDDVQTWIMIISGIGVMAAIALSLAIYLSISRGLRSLSGTMLTLANGDTELSIPKIESRDELADMARSLVVFRANARDLRSALQKERELNHLQREFVSLVSHEFRTPLAVIDGAAHRLLRKGDNATLDQRNATLTKVRNAVLQLTGLMESVLTSASLEAGSVKFNPKSMDLRSLVQKACDNQQEISGKHMIQLDIAALPASFLGDPKLLHQVLANLLSNAVKYSPDADRIQVSGGLTDAGVEIVVRDFGLGIPKDELPKLCERFFRASTSSGIQGTGIGLNLVKAFIEMHGGMMDVTSTEGQGSTFTVKLPRDLPADALVAAAA